MEERLNNLSAFSHSFLMEGALGTGAPAVSPLFSPPGEPRASASGFP